MQSSLFLVIAFVSSVWGATRWNPEFNCDGCILITTDESLIGTINPGPTTITTNTPDDIISVVIPDTTKVTRTPSTTSTTSISLWNPDVPVTNDPTTQKEIETPVTTSISLWNPDKPVEVITSTTQWEIVTTVSPDSPVEQPQIITSTLYSLTTYTPEPITTTHVIGSLITKTFKVTETSAIILLVTETTTVTKIGSITVGVPYVSHMTSTIIEPYTTVTSTRLHFPGYFNDTQQTVIQEEDCETLYYVSIFTTERVLQTQSVSYYTEYYEMIVTSTMLRWGFSLTDSYLLSTGYNYVVSTLYPETQVFTITSNIEIPVQTVPVLTTDVYVTTTTTTQTHHITVTPTQLFAVQTAATEYCVPDATYDKTTPTTDGSDNKILSVFTGYSNKLIVNRLYYFILLFITLF